MISKITKMVPKTYYIVDGVEFPANELFITLEHIISEGDSYDLDYYLHNYADKLVELGYLIKKYGCRQSIIYYDTEDGRAAALFEEILHL